MSEIINNTRLRIDEIKTLLLDLHNGKSVDETRDKLQQVMAAVPYNDVVKAEEELIKEGLPASEIIKYCDLHSQALKPNIDTSAAKNVPAGHPVDTFIEENNQLVKQLDKLELLFMHAERRKCTEPAGDFVMELRGVLNQLMDIEKHYQRKENLLFPFLEKHGITGPPTVMWGKDDEVRLKLKSALSVLGESGAALFEEINGIIDFALKPAVSAVREMIFKEEKILFPMCLDTLSETEWYEVYEQSGEIGYCLYVPAAEWKPDTAGTEEVKAAAGSGKIRLSTGSFTNEELEGLFNALPYDITFVDKDDNVRFFSHGEDRIFQRNKAILGRKVQFCHPPHSVHMVEQILNDFKSGKQNSAKFWINIKEKQVHIAYYAMRNPEGEYLGTLEVTQDIAPLKKIEGERRLLTYEN